VGRRLRLGADRARVLGGCGRTTLWEQACAGPQETAATGLSAPFPFPFDCRTPHPWQALPLIERYLASIPPRPPQPGPAGAAAASLAAGMRGAPRPGLGAPVAGGGTAAEATGRGSVAAAPGAPEAAGSSSRSSRDDGALPKAAAGAGAAAVAAAGAASSRACSGGGAEGADSTRAAATAAGTAAEAAAPTAGAGAGVESRPHCGKDARTVTPLPFEFPQAPVMEDVAVDMVGLTRIRRGLDRCLTGLDQASGATHAVSDCPARRVQAPAGRRPQMHDPAPGGCHHV
jgi:hypothetical protein